MRNLHSITPLNPTEWIWLNPQTMLGRPLGGGWTFMAHAYQIPRGTPPEQGTRDRQYWVPFSIPHLNNREFVITPACGKIRTTSRAPSFLIAYDRWNRNICENCQRTLNRIRFLEEVQREDPYYQLMVGTRLAERLAIPDPVSGL